LGRVQAVPHLCQFYPGICLATEEKAQKKLSQCEIFDAAIQRILIIPFVAGGH